MHFSGKEAADILIRKNGAFSFFIFFFFIFLYIVFFPHFFFVRFKRREKRTHDKDIDPWNVALRFTVRWNQTF